MRAPKLDRNIRMYIGRARGLGLTEIARFENISEGRAYQIITATEYQLAKGNIDYWDEYKRQNGSYANP